MKIFNSKKGEEAIGSDIKNIILALLVILVVLGLYIAARKFLNGMI